MKINYRFINFIVIITFMSIVSCSCITKSRTINNGIDKKKVIQDSIKRVQDSIKRVQDSIRNVELIKAKELSETKAFIDSNVVFAGKQIGLQLDTINKLGGLLYPRTYNPKTNEIRYIKNSNLGDWTLGFFPGCLWQMYALTHNEKWAKEAEKFTVGLEKAKGLTWHHDIGFMIGCSYGNGYNLMKIPEYKAVIIQAAKSLSTRYRPKAKIIQSWNVNIRGSWQSKRGWKCPVIIDNMMNLELLFEATKLSADSTFYKIAVNHANTTLKNHFRPDFSCYHVVDYDPNTGAVRSKETAQGYSNESDWARGQAWALYGYTVCYRYTKDIKYLQQAEHIANFIFTSKKLPKDFIPYWDYDAPDIPNAPRDASAAACSASALYELSDYVDGALKTQYLEWANKVMRSLSLDYRAKLGQNGFFILEHSVGALPFHNEIDVPLNYADYYFLQALYRMKQRENEIIFKR